MESIVGNTRRPDVSFYTGGRIDITARVAKMLSLDKGDVIDIISDGYEYYLYVRFKNNDVVGQYEAKCWPTKKGSHNYRASSARLCRKVMSLSGACTAAHLPVGETTTINGRAAVNIIIRNNLKNI